jgi:hypothetical protein
MDTGIVHVADALKDIAYRDQCPRSAVIPRWGEVRIEPIELDSFGGFVASSGQGVFLVFRGSACSAATAAAFERTIKNWIINMRFAQVEHGDCRIHKGFYCELYPKIKEISTALQDNGALRVHYT